MNHALQPGATYVAPGTFYALGEVTKYESRIQIVSLRNESDGGVSIRYLAEQPCSADSTAAAPRLEDLYLWLFPQSGGEHEGRCGG